LFDFCPASRRLQLRKSHQEHRDQCRPDLWHHRVDRCADERPSVQCTADRISVRVLFYLVADDRRLPDRRGSRGAPGSGIGPSHRGHSAPPPRPCELDDHPGWFVPTANGQVAARDPLRTAPSNRLWSHAGDSCSTGPAPEDPGGQLQAAL